MSFQFLDNSSNTGIVIGADVAEVQNVFDGGGTLMGWINLDGWGDLDFGRMAEKDGVSQHGWYWFVSGPAAPGGVNSGIGFVQRFSGTFGEWESPASSISLNTWHHVAVTYNSSSTANNAQFSIDSQSVTTTEISTPTGTREDDSGARAVLGNRLSDYGRQFYGRMADMRVYNRTLTAAEIQTIYTANGGDSIITGLVRRFPMSPLLDGIGPNTAYRYVTNNTGVTASLTINVPTQHADGDLLVLVVGDGANATGTAPNIATPAGWNPRLNFDLPAAASRPAVAVFTRIASSEPASYAVTSDQGSTPKAAYMYACPDITSEVPSASATNTGTDASVEAPSITPPDSNSLILRIACVDDSTNIPTPRASFYPADLAAGRRVQGVQGGGSNGIVLSVGEHHHDDTATGTQTFTSATTDEWGSASLSWTVDRSTGIEGLPGKDISLYAAHAQVQERGVVGGVDQLKIGGC